MTEKAKALFALQEYKLRQVSGHDGGRNLVYICSRGGEIAVNIPRGFDVSSSLSGIRYDVRAGRLFFRAENDFEVQSFKLLKKER